MIRSVTALALAWLAWAGCAAAASMDPQLTVYRLQALDNLQQPRPRFKSTSRAAPAQLDALYRAMIDRAVPAAGKIVVSASVGEARYVDLLVHRQGAQSPLTVSVSARPECTRLELSAVKPWRQAGLSTKRSSTHFFDTFELLGGDVYPDPLAGAWASVAGLDDWFYDPPDGSRRVDHELQWRRGAFIRLLVKIDILACHGAGESDIDVRFDGAAQDAFSQAIAVSVARHRLPELTAGAWKLWLYTGFLFDERGGRPGSYLNSMRLAGSDAAKRARIAVYFRDIREKGLNGVVVQDWRPRAVATVLRQADDAGLQDVVVHAVGPKQLYPGESEALPVTEEVVDLFRQFGFRPYFYGYDESGGNRRMSEQLALNQRIHALGAHAVNAIFWKDRLRFEQAADRQPGSRLDVVAVSMGSNGADRLFKALPLSKPRAKREGLWLGYWHPHVEQPIRNRLFAGYWLWASGLDGVIPHGYFFVPHYAKYRQQPGGAPVPDPYDDDSFWLPPGDLRQHATVYPHRTGIYSTLQWEGVRQGIDDLRFLIALDQRMANGSLSGAALTGAQRLRAEIRSLVLGIDSSHLASTELDKFVRLAPAWRERMRRILLSAVPADE